MNGETHCPLCAGRAISSYSRDRRRPYLNCATCSLVFVPPEYYLSRDAERAEYALHQNDIADPGYRQFLSRLAQPLVARLAPGARGLDFGCGPGPALAHMLRESGFDVAIFDSFFAPAEDVLAGSYAFICATEVVEHLHHPGRELDRLWSLLQPGGWLGIMTKLVRDRAAFASWHYKNDPTHVCFFSADTWQWWAQQHGASLEIIGADVILLQRYPPLLPQ
ncbi:MAG: class I SAM-dependent methyltransferase [Halioglobus sp.]|nr:class I SAM-dependent methyltransferase [Halioglobus sp.]